MDVLTTPECRVCLYDDGTTIRQIAIDKIKEQTDPEREDLEDPFIIFDLGDVLAKHKQWTKLLPSIQTFYAVKSNPDPVMLRLLLKLGTGFDCASKREIELLLSLGASPDRIIYANPIKQESHLRYARDKGVRLMTFDTEGELFKIKRIHPEAKLVIRVRYDDPDASFKLGLKFGCRDNEVRPLMVLAKKHGLEIVGISFHVGTESINAHVYGEAISNARPMFDLGKSMGFDMSLLDIGGGFPGRTNPKTPFTRFAAVVKKAVEEHFPASSGIRVIAEPGTFYTRSAGQLVANVIAKRIDDPNANKQRQSGKVAHDSLVWVYYLNVGVYNGFFVGAFDDGYFDLPEALQEKGPESRRVLRPTRIWGPTCDSVDVIFKQCTMPELEAGEFVLLRDSGAYFSCCASEFNGFGIPPTCYVAPEEMRPLLEEIFCPRGKLELPRCRRSIVMEWAPTTTTSTNK